MSGRDPENEADHRKNQFLDWAKEQLDRIEALTLSSSGERSASASDRRHLREVKKTLLLSLLETLARASQHGGEKEKKRNFVKFIEARGEWEDAKRISVLHLSRALDLHLQERPQDTDLWNGLENYVVSEHSWIHRGDGEEHEIKFDPLISIVEQRWPQNQKGERMKCFELNIWEFTHSYLLYRYRSCLVHDGREQTFSYESDRDTKAWYMTTDSLEGEREYHLVYPLGFLLALTRSCIAGIRREAAIEDPYERFKFGPYLIPELNPEEGTSGKEAKPRKQNRGPSLARC